METTEAPESTTNGTSQQHTVQLPSRRRRRTVLAILAVICLSAFVLLIIHLSNVEAEGKKDGEARDRFVAQRIEAASKMTQGGIQEQQNWAYDWSSSSMRIYFRITLGTCSDINAYVTMKSERPQHYRDTSPLVVVAPAVRRGLPDAEVPITAPNFYMAVSSSGLAHCINGDPRFVNIPPTE